MQVNVTRYQLKDMFEKSQNALIVLGKNADSDSASLAASLVELFEGYSKKAVLVSQSGLPEAAKPLVKNGQFKNKVEPKSLVLSFDWTKNSLDKVTYKIEGNKFNLIIHSKGQKLATEDITYSYEGSDFDLIVLVSVSGVAEIIELGLERDTFERLPSLVLAKGKQELGFGKLNVVSESADSVSALAASLFKESQINLPTRAAETILYGIRVSTNNFATVNDPATFEAAAYCKRAMIPGLAPSNQQENKPVVKQESSSEVPEGWLSPKIFRSDKFS